MSSRVTGQRSAQLSGVLARAALRVSEANERHHRHASHGESPSVCDAVTDAVLAVVDGKAVPSFATELRMDRAIPVIRSLRQALLAERSTGLSTDADVLDVLSALEQVETRCAADVAAQFAERLGAADAMELLVEVAHDLRSPIGSLLLLVDRMRKGHSGPVTPAQERQLGLVYAAAFGMSALASDVMELSRGGVALIGRRPVTFSVSEVVRLVCELVQPIAEEKGLLLTMAAHVADVRIGHPAAVYRVLLNLTTNALKFTNEGKVTVTAQSLNGDVVRFSVCDTGRGLPAQSTTDVYDVFPQPTQPRNHAFSSSGLGLAICQKLLGAMGGALQVVSAPDAGSEFSFELVLPHSKDASGHEMKKLQARAVG